MKNNELKNKIIAITSFCNSSEKVDVLVNNIKLLQYRFPDFDIALHANYPLSEDIQKSVDYYFYEDLNYTAPDKWIWYWNIITDGKPGSEPYFKKKFYYSIKDTGFSVFQQIKALTKYLIDYKWVMLINYDTSVEEIRLEDYNEDYDLSLHYFPDHRAFSLIMMYFNPKVFLEKVVKYFTFETWMLPEMVDKLNEERFHDMVVRSGIYYFGHDYKVSDKISNEPDYLKPNAPINEYFTNYLLYYNNNLLEVYIWGLLTEIKNITLKMNDMSVQLSNENKVGAFESSTGYHTTILKVVITKINDVNVSIPLQIKPGYSTRPI